MRRTERKWKSLSKQEREAFLQHAHENHEKNDYTKEHMRDMRKEIINRNKAIADEERQRKTEAVMRILEKKEERRLPTVRCATLCTPLALPSRPRRS